MCVAVFPLWVHIFPWKMGVLYPTSAFTATSVHQDLEQESQRRAREVETLEQQFSKVAADTWADHARTTKLEMELSSHRSNGENEI